jgi:hypothetical protein
MQKIFDYRSGLYELQQAKHFTPVHYMDLQIIKRRVLWRCTKLNQFALTEQEGEKRSLRKFYFLYKYLKAGIASQLAGSRPGS